MGGWVGGCSALKKAQHASTCCSLPVPFVCVSSSHQHLPNPPPASCSPCDKNSKTEMLARSNKFECDTCGSHQEAQRRIKIRAAPSCLILHLKRFKFIEHLRRCVLDTV